MIVINEIHDAKMKFLYFFVRGANDFVGFSYKNNIIIYLFL
jgi:hypothetical protein